MKNYKELLISTKYCFIPFIISVLSLTILNYINITSYKLTYILLFIFTLISYFIAGYKYAKKLGKDGILNGLIIGSLCAFVFLLISLITFKIKLISLLYFILLIVSSILGGVFGVNSKKKKPKY